MAGNRSSSPSKIRGRRRYVWPARSLHQGNLAPTLTTPTVLTLTSPANR
jgi:hypothetical protein